MSAIDRNTAISLCRHSWGGPTGADGLGEPWSLARARRSDVRAWLAGLLRTCLAALLVLTALGVGASAASAASITLVSGSGAVDSPDLSVTFTNSCGGSSQATIVPPYGAWSGPISGTQWDSPNAGYGACGGTYQTTFTLPAGAMAPSITVSDLADNSANVSVNAGQPFITGNVAGQCESGFTGPPVSGSTSTGLVAGANTLSFSVDNCGGQSATGIDFVATVTYGTAGASVPSLEASYTGTATNQTASVSGDLTLTGVTEGPQGQITGDATFNDGLVGGGAFVGTVSGSSVDLTIVSATPSPCAGGGCVAITLSGAIGSDGTLSGSYVVYSGSGAGSHGVWQVSPEAAPTAISTAVAVDGPVAGASGVDYTVDLTAGPSGALTSSSTIAIAFPPGTGVSACSQISLTDLTSDATGTPSSCSTSDSILAFTVPIDAADGDQLQVVLSGMTNTTSTGTQTVAVSTSADDAGSATYSLAEGGPLSGTVEYESSSGLEPVAGSIVQACDGTNCYFSTTETPNDGSYSFQLPLGTYTVTAFAPTSDAYSLGEGSTGPIETAAGQSTTADITLPAIAPLPSGVTFNGESGTVGIVYWGSAAPLSVQGCTGGFGVGLVTSLDWATGQPELSIGALAETPPGSGTYSSTVDPLYPSHGTGVFTAFTDCPPASALLPASGPAGGGNEVEIDGSGFTGATQVMFGTTPAPQFTVRSDSEILAEAPAGSGTVPVTVVTPGATIGSAALGNYTYMTVGGVSPSDGPQTGGTSVTLTGTGLANVQYVFFGDSPAAHVDAQSATTITATAPPGFGTVPVTVVSADGGATTAGPATFTYAPGGGSVSSAGRDDNERVALLARPDSARARPATQAEGEPLQAQLLAAPTHGLTDGPAAEPLAGPPAGLKLASGIHLAIEISEHLAEDLGSACTAGTSWGSALLAGIPMASLDVAADLAKEQIMEEAQPAISAFVYRIFSWLVDHGYEKLASWVPDWVDVNPWIVVLQLAHTDYELIANHQATADEIDAIVPCLGDGLLNLEDRAISAFQSVKQFLARIDPSGTVEDTNGNPVSGATVTLLRGDDPLGPFTALPPGSPIMDPSVNPETSDANGIFHWDVFAGSYQVTADKSGCTASGNPLLPTVSTGTFPVPPPQVGLLLTLSCPNEPPPAVPVVTGLSESSGPATGGTQVDVQGSGFSGSAKVSFGETPASAVTVLSPTDILATAPVGTGTVDVEVTTAGGTSAASAANQFSYVAAAAVSVISPTYGPPAGGTTVQITGSGFAADDQVLFGSTPAESVTVVSATEILVVAPSGTGIVDITVTNDDGTSATSPADEYTYLLAPANLASAATGVVQPLPPPPPPPGPGFLSLPVVSGVTTVGHLLSASTGSWTGAPPISYGYQWQRCNPICADIVGVAGAAGATYALTFADLGARIRVVVTARDPVGSASATSAEVGPVTPTPPTAAQIKASLLKQLAPTGKRARIAAILKAGGYAYAFHALTAGSVVFDWYYQPAGARIAAAKRKPVLVATGRLTFSAAGTKRLTMKLSRTGRKLLKGDQRKHPRRLTLIAAARFTPNGTAAVTARKKFTLKK
jgi:large repetitive protein